MTKPTSESVYAAFDTAFREITAAVILDAQGALVGKIAFRASERSGRVTCFLHIIGTPMTRGYASGGGYDKHSAAASAAARRLVDPGDRCGGLINADLERVRETLLPDDGRDWDRHLVDAGYQVVFAL